jgi:uncharacterized LabA/DUF88 family protein
LTPGFFLHILFAILLIEYNLLFEAKVARAGILSEKRKRKRVAVFIDGFNVYHFLNNYPDLNKYKWLDYNKLSKQFIPPESKIVSVNYFTALARWDAQKVRRHNIYIRALRSVGVNVIVGKFKYSARTFVVKDNNSKLRFKTRDGWINGRYQYGYTFEEKKTDVNIAVWMLKMAMKQEYDTALLMSGDTDFEPVIAVLNDEFPEIKVQIVVPNKGIAGSLRHLAGRGNYHIINEKHLKESQLDDEIILQDERKLTRPHNW